LILPTVNVRDVVGLLMNVGLSGYEYKCLPLPLEALTIGALNSAMMNLCAN